ncbi:hypothetical protein LCGC14_1152180 [marine sediment metagenome]|uniref:LamG-like jellyroll fold domain-containing protein n=1 Tax=marine sediment metagenome TaxID=412755 RepID=A0A0F9PDA4_9ZZZZ
MPIWRHLIAGAVLAEKFGDLADMRRRHTVTGNPTMIASPYGTAMELDGSTNYVTLGASHERGLRFDSGSQDFSLVAWIKPDASILGGVILGKEDGVNDGYRFWISGGGRLYLHLDAIDTFTDTGIVQPTDWQCIAAVVDRSDVVTLYLGGVDVTDTQPAVGGEVMATTSVPTVGCRSYDNGLIWHGAIGIVVAYPRILTPAEVLDLATNSAF